MNKFICTAYLSEDPEIRETADGMRMAKYRIGIPKKDGFDNLNCVAFKGNADFAEKYLTKGAHVLIEGRIQTGSYTNKDGRKVYTTDLVVASTEFCERKGTSDSPIAEKPSAGVTEGFMDITDEPDGLPFN